MIKKNQNHNSINYSESDIINKTDIDSVNISNKSENDINEQPIENTTIFGNDFLIKNPKKLGNLYCFLYINGNPIISIGVNNINFVIIYEIILNFSFIMFKLFMINILNKISIIYIKINYFTLLFCHLYLFLFNLGIVHRNCYATDFRKTEEYKSFSIEKKREYLYCEFCNIIVKKKYYVNHCEDCNICIYEYDHHCFWIGKCVSRKNIIFFYCFMWGSLIYIFGYFITILIWLFLIAN
jgi:hypothetical protein